MLRAGKDAESTSSVQMAEAWVDPRLRLAEEPKTPSSKGHTFAGAGGSVCSRRECLMLTALFVLAYLSGAEEIIFAYFTTLRCEPAIIRAGTNVTCEMSTSAYSREYDLSISQRGGAGPIELLASEPHWYRVTFATGTAGAAGLRARHAIFWTSSWVEVVAGPAVSAAVECGPPRVAPGAKVHCMVTTRDAHGNLAEVEKPADGARARASDASNVHVRDRCSTPLRKHGHSLSLTDTMPLPPLHSACQLLLHLADRQRARPGDPRHPRGVCGGCRRRGSE